jgi:predicted Zn-dependent protease
MTMSMNRLETTQAPAQRGLSAERARDLCNLVFGFAQADQTRVNVNSGWRGFTRTATNKITTAGGSTDTTVQITSVYGKRVARVTTNTLDPVGLEQAVRDAEALARLSPEDPEYLPELGPQEYETVNGYYASTGDLPPEARARSMSMALREATGSDTIAAGYMDARAGTTSVATSNGLFAHHPSTGVASTLTVRTPDGQSSGWAGDEAADWGRIESERVATVAVRKCLAWRGKTALDPGEYDVVLEPTAVGMLMRNMRNAFNARTADEGRSYFSRQDGGTRIGEQVFDSKVTIRSDPAEPDAETAPFTVDGSPVHPETWVENGVLRALSYGRFWADRQGVEPKPTPSNLIMSGGDATVEEMIASIQRGVLITRFWYIRGLNPRTISYTGLTRDGTFLVENGQISRPVNNFRFNQSMVSLLQNVEMLGRPTRVAAGENSSVSAPIVVPALKVRRFNLASVSDAI